MEIVAASRKSAIRLRFCACAAPRPLRRSRPPAGKESNDLLYPQEDRSGDKKKLVFACRNCDYKEDAGDEAEDNCVYRNIIDHTAAEKTVIKADVRADPTLPRTREATCPKEGCGHKEAVFFSTITAEGMTLFYQCMACEHKWNDVV
jgi:DNA-directed RNA polymerase II subunit RPB9